MKYFLYDSKMNENIEATEARPISLHEALGIYARLQFEKDTFLGLIRDDAQVLQFAGKKDKRILLVDIPIPTRNGSFQMSIVKEAGKEIIQDFFEGKSLEEIHNFNFCKW